MAFRRIGVVVVASTAGCALLTPLGDLGDASSADASDASDADVIQAEAGFCGALHGPAMIRVPSLNPNGPSYCIDATEVSEAQYDEFVKANVPPSSQPAFCAANTSFYPDLTLNFCGARPFDPVAHPTLPVACVDWCDAYAFCKWAGKRLCGAIGHDAGAVSPALANVAVDDQWFNACSAQGALQFPYGATYDASACNGADRSNDQVAPVGSLAGCVGGYPGIFDMSGNVGEWENDCLDASADGGVACAVRGGSVSELAGQLGCNQTDNLDRATTSYNYGFRCCAD